MKVKYPELIVVHQENAGKARALNNGIRNYVTKDLVMGLDGDSQVASDALAKMAAHFEADSQLVAAATNVRIASAHTLIEYAQKFEYLIGYKYKESEPSFNLEYIIGGIGSTFRLSALLAVGCYSTDSITEDIDLSMKMINVLGNKEAHFDYADDVLCFTPPAHNFTDLRKQRFRWKYGRFKALMKNRRLFFSRQFDKYSATLTWWKLPKIVFFEEVMMLLDPLLVGFMFYILYTYFDFTVVSGSLVTFLIVSLMSVFSDTTLSKKGTGRHDPDFPIDTDADVHHQCGRPLILAQMHHQVQGNHLQHQPNLKVDAHCPLTADKQMRIDSEANAPFIRTGRFFIS